MLRVLAGAVGEADDGEAGHAELEVGLDLDLPGIESYERMSDGAREHAPTLRRESARVCAASV